ncbi:MAG TPA: SDR family NAD(P)-dependent oxidoreductase [Nocardioidaceae bacterium]|nr:SDR family NAD(P)-dependent oxidoreductase [Nocardioidaceae bacterium]
MPTALITGPTAGLGRAFADAYARRGFDLVLVSRDADRLEQVAGEVSRAFGVGCEVLPADLAAADDVARVEARLGDEQRPVEAVVNNAGYGIAKWFGDTTVEEEQRSLDVLVRAPLRLSHAAVQQMQRRGGGEILNVSSVAGFTPRGTYGAHKAWVTSLTEWLNIAFRDKGIKATALCPGFVRTEFHQRGNMDMSRIPGWMWLEAQQVVDQAMRDLLAGKAVSVPTRRYQLLTAASRHLPRRLVARMARRGR